MGLLSWLSGNKYQSETESLLINGNNVSVYQANPHAQFMHEVKLGIEILIILILIILLFVTIRVTYKRQKRIRAQQQQLSMLGLDRLPRNI